MKIASLMLFAAFALAPALAGASPCAQATIEMLSLRDVRVEDCEALGPAHPDCIAQEDYEKGFLLSLLEHCPLQRPDCVRAGERYRLAWEQRSHLCRSGGAAGAPDCVAALQLEQGRLQPLVSCLVNGW